MIENLLDRPIAYHPCLVRLTGSVTAAILLGQAMYWQKRCDSEDGWWWKKREEWHDETGLSRQELETARKRCSKYLLYEVRGVPATGYYKVDFGAIMADFSSWRETRQLDGGKLANKLAENSPTSRGLSRQLLTKTTSEITHKSTPDCDLGIENVDAAETIYGLYPKKVARDEAIRAIRKAVKKFGAEILLKKVKEFKAIWQGADPSELQFCPYPATWFNQVRFNDDPSTWRNQKPKTNGEANGLPLFVQERTLKEAIKDHPANPDSLAYNSRSTPAQREELKALRAKLQGLNASMVNGLVHG